MLKKKICSLVLLCFLSFSVYFWYQLRYSNVPKWSRNALLFSLKDSQSENGLIKSGVDYRGIHLESDLGKENVGPLRIEFSTPVSLDTVRKENPGLQEGGRYKPHDCVALQKVALIIPFRHRDEHLKFWLYYLHPILQRQQLDYGVYVINQDGDNTFNRAKLMNIGYAEALKEYDYDCFVFSDVDIIPMDDRNTYKCFSQPRHLSVSMDKYGFKLPYNQYFGGVSSLSKEQIMKINGFPNNYWGWGGEDDDIFNRVDNRKMYISRPDSEVGKCRMIRHERDKNNNDNPQRFKRITHTLMTMDTDGLNSLEYEVVAVEKHDLFTKITVDVGMPPED
ncbi:beta-1,4-galactosyltransferase 1 isoform X2 [Salmo salar]|uniref:Beta-1,4-galactosyltransferase n=1 Tax=Salmo salar TaxID=8030 RepID=A0A1S3RER6_SALSA|nr:beta-1,4-galactosyltransferase 1-like isoform X2 [Salmo salar]|eukprot:XP_014050808.1 PREDICTED: beta-1,4-galactosyltransferase 1-like isoform X2 [Salmo salar]